jgi:hypothetical protein
MSRVAVHIRVDERLEARTRAYGQENGLSPRQVHELALAQLFDLPPAVRGVDNLALCPHCEKAVISSGRCDHCNWHEQPRPWKKHAHP